jgi:hypothetical protein
MLQRLRGGLILFSRLRLSLSSLNVFSLALPHGFSIVGIVRPTTDSN